MFTARFMTKMVLRVTIFCLLTSSVWAANILFITSDPTQPPGSLDYLLRDFFVSMGHTVTYMKDTTDEADMRAAAQATDLVYISESVSSSQVNTKITSIQTPMIISESYLWDDMGLTTNGGGDALPMDTSITITDPSHFLAAGLSGNVQVLTALSGSLGDAAFPKGVTGGDADVIAQATLSDNVTYDVLCVYDKWAKLAVAPPDGSPQIAADIRIGFFLRQSDEDIMAPDAYKLLAAAVNYGLGATKQARVPAPGSDNTHAQAASLSWTAGQGAVSHNVYVGTSPNLSAADLVSSQQTGTTYTPADPFAPGQTYYWRVDEVDGSGNVTTGLTWNFTVALLTASNPEVADGSAYVGVDPHLSWVAGYGSTTHNVYFGDNIDKVTQATPNSPEFYGALTDTTFAPGPLQKGYSYFWRVDEVSSDGQTIHTGNVWTFSTIPDIPIYDPNLVGWWKLDDDGVNIAVDDSGHDNYGQILGDQMTWNYDGADGDALEFPGTAGNFVELPTNLITTEHGTICMWMLGPDQAYLDSIPNSNDARLVAFNGAHDPSGTGYGSAREITLCCHSSGKARFFMEGGDLGDINLYGDSLTDGNWHHVAVTWDINGDVIMYFDGQEVTSTPHLGADYPLDVGMRLGAPGRSIRLWKGSLDDVRLYDYALDQNEVQQTMLGDPRLAKSPTPANHLFASVDMNELSWTPGENAAYHDVYFGTDRNDVALANITSGGGVYRGRQSLDDTTYVLPEPLSFGQTYYWRIDEVNDGNAISKGRVWTFGVSNNIIVDDFESYSNDSPHQPFQTWLDRWGYPADQFLPGATGNNTGAQTGYDTPDYMETSDVASGAQALPIIYDNTGQTYPAYSQIDRTWADPQDWTLNDVYALQMSLKGRPAAWSDDNGTFTVTSEGQDIFNFSDEFRYVYKQVTGDFTMVARVDSVEPVDDWSMAGLMMRASLAPGDKFAMVCQTAAKGIRFRVRQNANINALSDTDVATNEQQTLTAPYWIKLVCSGYDYSAYYSADGSNWTAMSWNPQQVISVSSVYIGMAVCSHAEGQYCTAQFSNVSITGSVSGDWTLANIGVGPDNAPDQIYVTLKDSSGHSGTVFHPDGNTATLLEDWTPWQIPLSDFNNQGVDLTSIKSMHFGIGNADQPTPGGQGVMLLDDILLLRPQ